MKKVLYLDNETHKTIKILSAKEGLNMKDYIEKIFKEIKEKE